MADEDEVAVETTDEALAQDAVEQVQARRSDAENWAKPTGALKLSEVPEGAINLNVEGRRTVSPLQGFGKLWQKTYRIPVGTEVTPKEVIAEWKARFPEFWPPGNNFFASSLTGIAPGEVALLNLAVPGRLKLSTGVLVIYADEESFTFMTPSGHGFAAFITFSAEEAEGQTWAQVQALLRANDPIYEVGMPILMNRMEDRFWHQTLQNLAQHFGVRAEVTQRNVCVDKRRQWRYWKNVWHNAFIRSALYSLGTPFRAAGRAVGRKESQAPSDN